jgi:hypothetical protein
MLHYKANSIGGAEMKNFPTYADVYAAADNGCFSCHRRLNAGDYRNHGYANGRGRWGIKCQYCGATKFFDLEYDPVQNDSFSGSWCTDY